MMKTTTFFRLLHVPSTPRATPWRIWVRALDTAMVETTVHAMEEVMDRINKWNVVTSF